MKFDFAQYRSRVRGCFVGKCVGGTLGMRLEGNTNYHPGITYYDPVPDTMLPNDDLDLQVVHLETVLRTGLPVSRYYLGENWKHHLVDNAPDEYSVSISNHARKIFAPLSGQYRNKFSAGMGAAIRSELWACMAPANPDLAAMLAREDACTDHCSDGVYAEMFLAAMESAAFTETDLSRLIEIGLRYIPDGHRLKNAFADVIQWWDTLRDEYAVRQRIIEKYGVDNWTDVTINLSYIILSLISCGGDFDKAVCTAVTFGYDTDCTSATVGSIFGIMNPDGIGKKWTDPIGDALVLSHCIVNMHAPSTIDAFCDRVITVAEAVQTLYNTGISLSLPADFPRAKLAPAWTENVKAAHDWQESAKEALLCVKPVMVTLQYPETVAARPRTENRYALRITNTTAAPVAGRVQLMLPDGWESACADPSCSLAPGESACIPFTVTPGTAERRASLNLLTVTVTVNGMTFETEAGLPLSAPWTVENLATGERSVFEADSICFPIPAGRYKYTAKFISPAPKEVRVCAGGRRACKLWLNGAEAAERTGARYVPAFHREKDWFKTTVLNGENTVEVVFEDGDAGEFFFGFATTFGCATWLDTMEWLE